MCDPQCWLHTSKVERCGDVEPGEGRDSRWVPLEGRAEDDPCMAALRAFPSAALTAAISSGENVHSCSVHHSQAATAMMMTDVDMSFLCI